MNENSTLFNTLMPPQAAALAWEYDLFYIAMVVFSIIMTIAIFAGIVGLCVIYRKRSDSYVPPVVHTSHAIELTWSIIPLILVIGMFVWGAELFFKQRRIPADAMDIAATGKQWMFKFQHPNGRREIGNLHLPVGVPIKMTLASEDVIHNVFIPAFRVKKDMLPGRYTYMTFTPTKVGEYHIFCNQYCGTQHSEMIGKAIVMEQADYQNWLAGLSSDPPEKAGEALFERYACNTCHIDVNGARGPALGGIIGRVIELEGGGQLVADEDYIRESILNPMAKVHKGYQPIMPSFQGVLSDEQVRQLTAYIKSLPDAGDSVAAPAAAPGNN
jgi:cytochrome c oxidase subunit 2